MEIVNVSKWDYQPYAYFLHLKTSGVEIDDQKPDFENDDLNYLMEEEIRATLKDRAWRRKTDKIVLRIFGVLALLFLVAIVVLPVTCHYALKNKSVQEKSLE